MGFVEVWGGPLYLWDSGLQRAREDKERTMSNGQQLEHVVLESSCTAGDYDAERMSGAI